MRKTIVAGRSSRCNSSTADAAKWTVTRAERVVTAGHDAEPRFEIAVTHGKDKAEIVFAADGTLLRTE